LLLRTLVLATAAAGVWFWLWWFSSGHGAWTPLTVLSTAWLAWVFLTPAYFLLFACRMTRPDPRVALPALRVAMVVTKAPSEPWPVVRRTLEAMLAQQFPSSYDVWLADERPDPETRAWCDAHGVGVSTRDGIEAYHQPTWPRRTRCKEGNLAYFYDTVGYADYDVVVQLDADHVPAPSYLEAMVRPFACDTVGYVCAPSICDTNASAGWTVRGRLHREAALHGPMQAGANDGYAPLCYGSHYAVRTAALRDVGGLGPELAEDYTTTVWLQCGGWDGVFAIDAEAHGAGPASLHDLLTQEVQWARSLGAVLSRWMPQKARRLPWRARLHLCFSLLFYPAMGCMLTMAFVLPVAGVVLRRSWGGSTLLAFYAHLWAASLLLVVTAAYLRHLRLFRPRDAKMWSWEATIFQVSRWPWALTGFLQGVADGRRARTTSFSVTSKAPGGEGVLAARWLLPLLVLGAVPAWTVVLTSPRSLLLGPALLCIVEAGIYLLTVLAVMALHLAPNYRSPSRVEGGGDEDENGSGPAWRSLTLGGACVFLVTVLTVTVLVLRLLHGLI
jgi:cellulose synthase/poly-beta-1,6-N-acetylglucosamine synthase-like glycosyltransferase